MTDEKMKWEAMINNDSSYDGKFYYAVKSTGCFCKPSCKSKIPMQANVVYFATASAAVQAGFRPCKRCRPDLPDYQPLREIAESVKRVIEEHYKERDLLMANLDKIGISPHRRSEIFKEHLGMTPNQYAEQLKMQDAKKRLQSGEESILDIGLSLGFDSGTAFYAFFRRHTQMTPKEYRRQSRSPQAQTRKYCASYDTAIGEILISSDGESVTEVRFATTAQATIAQMENQYSPCRLTDIAATQLEAYLAGKRREFDLPLHPAGTEFQRRVWDSLRSIPYGEKRSYKQVAVDIGNPNASRAVGMANNKNPIAIVIPCHRVVGSNGKLVGYAGGLELKQRLLDLEQRSGSVVMLEENDKKR